jgi:diguanylate cyclase (GGDEF)-like protein
MLKTAPQYRRSLIIISAIAGAVLVGVGLLFWRDLMPITWPVTNRQNEIRNLQDLPLGPVHVEGVVTYVDGPAKKFWIQDDSGALAIEQDPSALNLHVRQTVHVEAKKTQMYNAARGLASVALRNVVVIPSKRYRELPEPIPVSSETLPQLVDNGVRIQMKGVVHEIGSDEFGRVRMVVGDSPKEISVLGPSLTEDVSNWTNSEIQFVGVIETQTDPEGTVIARQVLVQERRDLQVDVRNKPIPKLYSLRQLYSTSEAHNGHAVRVRGRAVARLGTNTWILGSQFGAIECNFDNHPTLTGGEYVEVVGFPLMTTAQSRELDLFHATATILGPKQAEEGSNKEQNIVPLTTLGAVRDLSATQASQALPVRITATVTGAPSFGKRMFVQDSTAGMYVQFSGSRSRLRLGERVTLIGLTGPGPFSPEILAARFTYHGQTALPKPVPLTALNANWGELAARIVELEGVVHSLKPSSKSQPFRYFDLYSSIGVISIGSSLNEAYLREIEDATVRVRGIYIPLYNTQRQMINAWLSVTEKNDIEVLDPPVSGVFQQKAIPISQLLFFSPHSRFNHRVKIRGTVTALGPGFYYVQDESGGVEVLGESPNIRVADLLEVVGYAAPGTYSPILRDARARVLQHNVEVLVERASAQSLAQGHADSKLVSIDGKLLNTMASPDSITFIVQSGDRVFNAVLHLSSGQHGPDLEPGSTLRLTGISSAQPELNNVSAVVQSGGFRFMIRSPADIQVLRTAPWWNAKRTVAVVISLFLTTFAAGMWIRQLRVRVRRQESELQEAMVKAKALEDLANTMDKVARHEEFTARVEVQGNGDIARLGMQFNKMLTELQQRERAKAEAEAKLRRQALTDELTGLPNRRLLNDRLTQALALARRIRSVVAVMYIDLDGFKVVNDSLGHNLGDLLLKQVAQRLSSHIRKADTLARMGGDEFTVLLTHLHTKEEAELIGKTLLEAICKPFILDDHKITVSASIGISAYPENGVDPAMLLENADSAMYSAKRSGKNRILYFTPALGSVARERVTFEGELREAVSRGEITVHYQPEWDLVSGKIVRFEALARWTHPTLGSIPPSKFIPIAEESGLIIPIGMHILQCACSEAVIWQRMSRDPIQLAVNISNIQFAREGFVDEVATVLSSAGLDPTLLQIELTESIMLASTELTTNAVNRLSDLGVSIAIDDFGTGYSCFGYLSRLPFSTLKIDRTFVKEIENRPQTKALVESMIALAHNLQMRVVVEGIETAQELDTIRAVGSDEVQGFLLGRPSSTPSALLTKARRIDSYGSCPPVGTALEEEAHSLI